MLLIAMLGAFAAPFVGRFPYPIWWIPASAVAVIVLEGTRRRKSIRRGRVWFAAWMLLTVGLVELLFWAGEQVMRAD